MRRPLLFALASLLIAAAPAPWTVRPEWVRAHEAFLASDALDGRGSATRDEAIAAAYVAARFAEYGLKPAPGMTDYLQSAAVVRTHLAGTPRLEVDGKPVDGLHLFFGTASAIAGKAVTFASANLDDLPEGAPVVLLAGYTGSLNAAYNAARARHIGLLIGPQSEATETSFARRGGVPSMPRYLAESPPASDTALGTLPAATLAALAKAGGTVRLVLPTTTEAATTTNAIGYLPGADPSAGVLLLSAHLDHLGQAPGGPIMHGANDDASGTTAVLELAHALGHDRQTRRGILFVCYGAEEIGGYGSRYFGAHPPVPLDRIVANLEFEMIGAQDPKLPRGALMMTGYDRSTLGAALQKQGAAIAPDPYPDEHFFQRSDNYSLALRGVVAHTLSGWAVVPTYHQPTDTLANLDIGYMTAAIQSLIAPVRWLADSDFKPGWTGAGRPGE